jgi:tetratricopeptide (TPR) repeat protein
VTTLACPARCGADNEPDAERCTGCGAPLRNHARLTEHAAHLFNNGLRAAANGELATARELFAALVHWHPRDRDARNALALANFQLGDHDRARHHWTEVRAQRPNDAFADAGLRRLDALDTETAQTPQRTLTASSRAQRRRRQRLRHKRKH